MNALGKAVCAMTAAIGLGHPANAAEPGAVREAAGSLSGGEPVEAITLSNGQGVSARILTYGATLQALTAPGRDGTPADIVVGYDDVAAFEKQPNYFGTTIGRYANRIAGGRFTLDGKVYQVPTNNGANSLHGGGKGFDKQNWRIVAVGSGTTPSVKLAHRSADGDSGYPGTLDATVTYSLDASGALTIVFEATTDKPTIVNMTNHAIFDLAGEGSATGVLGQRLTIPARAYTPVDAGLIPTGELRPVEGTVFDFRNGRTLSDGIRDGRDEQIVLGRGYDHNFALDKGVTSRPELAARLEDPASGRVLEVLTTEPGLQVYTGNFLDGTRRSTSGGRYRQGDGVALEPQLFPDSPNRPEWPSAVLRPGKTYAAHLEWRFATT